MKKLFVILLLLGSSAFATTVIDTYPTWSTLGYVSYVNTWGSRDDASTIFGQTVTVPVNGDVYLDSFTFYINTPTSIPAQAYIYSWDSTNNWAISQFWASPQVTVPVAPDESTYVPVTMTPRVELAAGEQYVLFLAAAALPANSAAYWAGNSDLLPPDGAATDWYSGGGFFYSNSGDSSQFTTTSWGTYPFAGSDLAFNAQFDSTGPVPEPSTLAMGLLPLAALVVYRRRRV